MNKVPNIVFLIIAIVGLTAAGILFAMYSSEKERSFNSLNEIARLEADINNLMNKNSDLMMQMTGIEDQKEKLEEKVKKGEEIKCDTDECLMSAPLDDMYGLAKIKGYYTEREEELADPGTGEKITAVCNSFVVTDGPERVIEKYLSHNMYDKNEKGQPIANIGGEGLVKNKTLIEESDVENQIELTIFHEYQPPVGYEGQSCVLGFEILRVN
ncbi:hypothetical protein GF382_01245 [Candidatus Falkowbacteria bacterium]|nr:hypothetical protein [Candidatus Falkowbacteria bacterium]